MCPRGEMAMTQLIKRRELVYDGSSTTLADYKIHRTVHIPTWLSDITCKQK